LITEQWAHCSKRKILAVKTASENIVMEDCKFGNPEVVNGIVHKICKSPALMDINKPKNGEQKPITCIGEKCGQYVRKDRL